MTQNVDQEIAADASEQELRQRAEGHEGHEGHRAGTAHGGHSWLMIACCIPMLVLAVALVATGVVGASFILIALGCTAMMALMMRGGHGGHR